MPAELQQLLCFCRSPVEIYYGSELALIPRYKYVEGLLAKFWSYSERNRLTEVMTYGHALYSANNKIGKYKGKDYLYLKFAKPDLSINPLEKEFNNLIYNSISPRGKAIFNAAYSQFTDNDFDEFEEFDEFQEFEEFRECEEFDEFEEFQEFEEFKAFDDLEEVESL